MLLWKNLHFDALASRISGQLPVSGVCCLSHPDWEGLTFLFRRPDLPFAFRHQYQQGFVPSISCTDTASPLLWDPVAIVGSIY